MFGRASSHWTEPTLMILPRFARDHEAGDRLGDEEDAIQIGAHEFAPSLFRVILQRPPALNAGVVDQDVDRTELRLDTRDRLADLRPLRDVERRGMGLGAGGAQRLDRGFDRLRRAAVDDDARAGARQPAGERQSDAGGRTGDQGHGP
jgi:hypothetical protein